MVLWLLQQHIMIIAERMVWCLKSIQIIIIYLLKQLCQFSIGLRNKSNYQFV